MTRIAFLILAVLAPFFFPWHYTIALMFVGALYVPLLGILVGLLTDCLYYSHGISHLPWATLWGAAASIVAILVRRFVKTRIMGA